MQAQYMFPYLCGAAACRPLVRCIGAVGIMASASGRKVLRPYWGVAVGDVKAISRGAADDYVRQSCA